MSGDGADRSDADLLRAYRDGDTHAFEALLARHRTVLFNFLLRRVGDRGRTEELYQDVWLKVIDRCDTFRGDAKFTTWLYKIARNQCIDHQRRMSFRRHASLDESDAAGMGPKVERVAAKSRGTARAAEDARLRTKISDAVDTLPVEQREVFVLRQIQGMAFADIADVVSVPVNTVKSRMRYALERLRLELAEFEEHATQPGKLDDV